jgi:hypothetical protein
MQHINFRATLPGVCQMAFIVKDIKSATNAFTAATDTGPWCFADAVAVPKAVYRGSPIN